MIAQNQNEEVNPVSPAPDYMHGGILEVNYDFISKNEPEKATPGFQPKHTNSSKFDVSQDIVEEEEEREIAHVDVKCTQTDLIHEHLDEDKEEESAEAEEEEDSCQDKSEDEDIE